VFREGRIACRVSVRGKHPGPGGGDLRASTAASQGSRASGTGPGHDNRCRAHGEANRFFLPDGPAWRLKEARRQAAGREARATGPAETAAGKSEGPSAGGQTHRGGALRTPGSSGATISRYRPGSPFALRELSLRWREASQRLSPQRSGSHHRGCKPRRLVLRHSSCGLWSVGGRARAGGRGGCRPPSGRHGRP